MASEEDRLKQLGWELGQAIQTSLAKSFHRSFADAVRDYRQIETDFVARTGDHEFFVLETKRRIAEMILLAAHSHEQSFEVCRDAWNDLVRLGFTNLRTRCTETWFYADCCLFNEQFDAGIAVLEPLMVELRQRIDESTVNGRPSVFCPEELDRLVKLRDELEAQHK